MFDQFLNQRYVPLAYQEKTINKLKRMESEVVIAKIDSSRGFCKMVIPPKPNDAIRICTELGNANKAVIPDRYPLPTMDDRSKFFAHAIDSRK